MASSLARLAPPALLLALLAAPAGAAALGAEVARLSFDAVVLDISWSPDGRLIAVALASSDYNRSWLAVVDSGGRELWRFEVAGLGVAQSVAWSPQGDLVAVGGPGGVAAFTPDGGEAWSLEGVRATWVAWSPDGRYLAAATVKALLGPSEVVVASRDGAAAWRAGFGDAYLASAAWDPAGELLAVALELPETGYELAVFQAPWGRAAWTVSLEERPGLVAWSPDGRRLAVVEGRNVVTAYTRDGGLAWSRAVASVYEVTELAWSPRGTLLAVVGVAPGEAGLSAVVQALDARTGRVEWTLGPLEPVGAAAWSPGGDYLALLTGKGLLYLVGEDGEAAGTVEVVKAAEGEYVIFQGMEWGPQGGSIAAYSGSTLFIITLPGEAAGPPGGEPPETTTTEYAYTETPADATPTATPTAEPTGEPGGEPAKTTPGPSDSGDSASPLPTMLLVIIAVLVVAAAVASRRR